jgi:hypothetical protein
MANDDSCCLLLIPDRDTPPGKKIVSSVVELSRTPHVGLSEWAVQARLRLTVRRRRRWSLHSIYTRVRCRAKRYAENYAKVRR